MLAAFRAGRPVAAAALTRFRRHGLVEVTHLAADPHRFASGLVWRDDRAREQLVDALRRLPGDILRLSEVHADDPVVGSLRRRYPGTRLVPTLPDHVIDLGAGDAVSSRLRSELRRASRRAAERGLETATTVVSDGEEIRRLIPAMRDVAGRRSGSEPALPHVGTPEGLDHVTSMWHACVDEKRMAVATVTVNGHLAAFATVITLGDVARGHLTARDRSHGDVPSIGWMALVAMIDHLRERGVRLYDLASGGAENKRRVASPRAAIDIAVPLSGAGRAAITLGGLRRTMRRKLRAHGR